MLYTASYFETFHYRGQLVSISRSIPKGFKVDDKLQFLAPTEDLLADWKAEKISEADYIVRYTAD